MYIARMMSHWLRFADDIGNKRHQERLQKDARGAQQAVPANRAGPRREPLKLVGGKGRA